MSDASQTSGRTSPAAGRYSEAAVRKGSQAVASGMTPASTSLPPAQAGPDPFAADAVGAPASEGTPGALEEVTRMRNDTSW